MKKLLMSVLLLSSVTSHAVSITAKTKTCGVLNTTLCQAAEDAITTAVNATSSLPDVSVDKYAAGIASATGFAYQGLGSDYSDNFDLFVIRAGGGLAVSGDLSKPDEADGIGIGVGMTVGVNLAVLPVDKIGPIDISKMDILVSYMGYSIDQTSNGSSFKGDISYLSAMVRYQILEGKTFVPGHLLEWGGIFLHTGFQKSGFNVSLSQSIKDQSIDIGNGNAANLTNSSATFGIKSSSLTIPIEVSTYARLAYIFTLYGGAGFDIISGKGDVDLTAGGVAKDGTTGYEATITANGLSGSGDAEATNFRAFAGAQFNLPLFRLYAQVNKGLGSKLIGASLGAKVLW